MRPFVRALCAACAALAVVVTVGAADPPYPRKAVPAKDQRPPAPKFAPLPSKAVGVLVADVKGAMAAEGRSGPAEAVGFASSLGSYRWVYLPCPGKSDEAVAVTVRTGEAAGEAKQFRDVCIATEADLRRLKIPHPYALVEVEVNGGLGCPATADRFVATKLRLVEGTDAYPRHVADEVHRWGKKYKEHFTEQEKLIRETMDHLAGKALGKRPPTGPRETEQQTYVTWLPERSLLHIEFRTRITDGDYRYGKGTQPGPMARRVPASPPKREGARYGTAFGVELGMIYEVSKTGELEHSEPVPVRTFVKEIPPPQAAR